jgi:hypothetical protein
LNFLAIVFLVKLVYNVLLGFVYGEFLRGTWQKVGTRLINKNISSWFIFLKYGLPTDDIEGPRYFDHAKVA